MVTTLTRLLIVFITEPISNVLVIPVQTSSPSVHVDLDLADELGLHVARSVDDGIERVVVAIKSSVITDGSVDSAGDVGGRGVMLQ